MMGRRKYLRVKGYTRITWNMPKGPSGSADVVDFSISGIQFILDRYFELPVGSEIFIDGKDPGRLSGLRKVRIKWAVKIMYCGNECLKCGGDFI